MTKITFKINDFDKNDFKHSSFLNYKILGRHLDNLEKWL